jgi:hypothetical protein
MRSREERCWNVAKPVLLRFIAFATAADDDSGIRAGAKAEAALNVLAAARKSIIPLIISVSAILVVCRDYGC